jgi:hypothetical protein
MSRLASLSAGRLAARSPIRLRDAANVVEKEVSRALLAAVEATLGPAAAVAVFAHAPLLRRTPARLRFLRDRIRRRRGDAAAQAAALRLLTGRPAGFWYATLLEPGPAAPDAAALEAAGARIIAAAPSTEDLALLTVALHDCGQLALAQRCLAAMRERPDAGTAAEALAASCLRPLGAPPPDMGPAAALGALDPGPAEHRLVIAEKTIPLGSIAALGAGARRLTVMTFGDLYAAGDMATGLAEALPGVAISVEHARSRLDRFSTPYHALHRSTAESAALLIGAWSELLAALSPAEIEPQALRPALELELADLLFFASLRATAVHLAARDATFDDVVLCFDRDWRFHRVALCDPALAADPRLRACCRATTVAARRSHFARQREVLNRRDAPPAPQPLTRARRAASMKAVARHLAAAGRARAKPRADDARDAVALISGQDRAYVRDSAEIAMALSRRFDVDVLWTRGRAAVMRDALAAAADGLLDASASPPPTLIGLTDGPSPEAVAALSRLLRADGAAALAALDERLAGAPAAAAALDCEMDGAVPQTLLAALARTRAGLATIRARRHRAVVVCSARTPMNLQVAAAARAAGAPSVAVEPHCLNAAYCRYAATPTDATLVCLEHLAQEYRAYFGAAPERCEAVGSPRIRPPRGYHGAAARLSARAELGFGAADPPIVLAPTQPMAETHAFAVWRMAARGVAAMGRPVRLLVKVHPEEGPDRARQYLSIAAEEGAGAFCAVAEGDIKTLIRASAAVLVYYSVTALEAAALDRPVVVIGRRETPYPVPYHEILGAPFCASADEVAAALGAALDRDGAPSPAMTAFRAANPTLFDNGFEARLVDAVARIAAEGRAALRPADALPRDPFVTAPFRPYFEETP